MELTKEQYVSELLSLKSGLVLLSAEVSKVRSAEVAVNNAAKKREEE